MDCTVFRVKKDNLKSNFAFVYSNGVAAIGCAISSTTGEYREFVTDLTTIEKISSNKVVLHGISKLQVSDLEIEIINPSSLLDRVPRLEMILLLLSWVSLNATTNQLKLYDPYVNIFSSIVSKKDKISYLNIFNLAFSSRMAQKLIPVPRAAMDNTNDRSLSVWKEIDVSNLNIDGIVKLSDYFYIRKSGKYLYDSQIIRRKFKISEDMEDFLLDMNKIRKNIKVEDSGLNLAIQFPIYYAKQQLLLSDLSLCLLFPSKGISLDSIKNMNLDIKQITEYLLNLNKNGIIHGDLHSGNVTWDGKHYWIIDFSESVLYPNIDDILTFYKNYFQTFYEHNEDKLKRMVNMDKESLFILWTAWDWYKFSSDIINNPSIVNKDVLPKIKKINDYSFTHLTNLPSSNKSTVNFNEHLLSLGLLTNPDTPKHE